MAKKTKELSETELRIQNLELALVNITNVMLTINDAKKRDYIVRTKYYGKIVDPNIKKDFKEEIEDKLKNTFSGICNNILNFEFSYKDEIYECEDILQVFYSILNKYEYKQIILDTYGKDK